LRRFLLASLGLAALAAGLAAWLAGTASGLGWLLALARPWLPGELQVGRVRGSLWGGFRLERPDYRQGAWRFQAEALVLRWQPLALGQRRLHVRRLALVRPRLVLPPGAQGGGGAVPPLPTLPLAVRIDDLSIRAAELVRGDRRLTITEVAGGVGLDAHRLRFRAFHLATARGRLDLDGDLASVAGGGRLEVRWQLRQQGRRWRGRGRLSGAWPQLVFQQRLLAPLVARAEGRLDLERPERPWRLRLQLPALPLPAPLRLGAPAPTARWVIEGRGSGGRARVRGRVQVGPARPLAFEFKVRGLNGPTWQITDLHLQRDQQRLTGRLEWRPAGQRLQGTLSWQRLGWPLWGPTAWRSAGGELALEGPLGALHWRIQGRLQPPRGPDLALSGSGRLRDTGLRLDQGRVAALGGVIGGQGRLDWRPRLAWDFRLRAQHLDPGRYWARLPGDLSGRFRLSGGPGTMQVRVYRLQGRLRGRALAVRGRLDRRAGRWRLQRVHVDAGSARLALDGDLGAAADLRWSIQAPDLADLWPGLQGGLEGRGRLRGSLARPRLEGRLAGRDLAWRDLRLARLQARAAVAAARTAPLRLDLALGGLQLGVERLERASLYLEGSQARHRFRLALTGPRLAWEGSGQGSWSGRRLHETLAQGRCRLPGLGLDIRPLTLEARLDAGGLQLDGRARSGPGRLRLEARLGLVGDHCCRGEIRLRGDRFLAVARPDLRLLLSPDLRLAVTPGRLALAGRLAVPAGRIAPRQGLQGAVAPSPDVHLVQQAAARPRRWRLDSHLDLVLGPDLALDAFGLSGRLQGRLQLTQAANAPAHARGRLQVVGGRYRAYGQDLEIERGQLLYTGGTVDDPGLDIRARRVLDEVQVGVLVSGRLRQPELRLFSDPAMEQADILSYLVTGRPARALNSAQGALVARAADSLGLKGGNFLAGQVRDRLGLDQLSITGKTREEAGLALGKYLSPRLYLGYSRGLFDATEKLNLRYRLGRHLRLETETGTSGSGGDLIWSIER